MKSFKHMKPLFSFFSIPTHQIFIAILIFGSLAFGQWLFVDMFHFPGGELGFFAALATVWLISQSSDGSFNSPVTVEAWSRRCHEVIDQFEQLEEVSNSKERLKNLNLILERPNTQCVAFIASHEFILPDETEIKNSLSEKVDNSFEVSIL